MELKELREQIDEVDKKILTLVADRLAIVQKVGELKQARKMPIVDRQRVKAALQIRKAFGKTLGISEDFVEKIYQLLHDQAVEKEEE